MMIFLRSKRILSAISASVALAVFYYEYGLYRFGPGAFGQPWLYGGDNFLFLPLIQALRRGEWFPFSGIRTTLMGGPHGSNLADFPLIDQLHLLGLTLLSWFTPNPFLIFNLYYFFGFALASVGMTLCLRKLRVDPWIALGLGWIYAFLPYHLIRFDHLFLGSYFALPWSVLWLFKLSQPNRRAFKLLPLLLFGIIFGSLGVYYAFFFCFFALLLGLIVCMRERTWISLQRPIQAVLAVALGSFINLVPNLLYWLKFGRNQEVANRQPWEASLYGLRLGNVIFPTEGHGGGIFAVAHERYFGPIGATEGIAEYWGIFTITGIALLLFFSYRKSTRFDFIARLRTLLVGGLLLGLVGGFGGIFNVLISPQIRCYNRISINLATFGLFSLGIYSQHLFRVLRTRGLPLWFPPIFISCVVYVALSDQILRGWKYSPHTAETSSDRAFIENIEEKYPNNKMTLQLPYVSFPEYGSVFKMEDLSHLRVLLYAKHMSVSYGAIKGRPEAREIEQVSAFPFVPAVARTAGYDGVYIDRFGFSDNAVLLDTQLRQQLQENPVESPNGRLLYFSLR